MMMCLWYFENCTSYWLNAEFASEHFSRCAILQSVPQLHHNPSEQTTNGFFCFLAMLIGRRDVFCCSAEPLCSMYGTPSPYVNKKLVQALIPTSAFSESPFCHFRSVGESETLIRVLFPFRSEMISRRVYFKRYF